jgi:hypothetical protein
VLVIPASEMEPLMFNQPRANSTLQSKIAKRFIFSLMSFPCFILIAVPSYASDRYSLLIVELESCYSILKPLERVKCFDQITKAHSNERLETSTKRQASIEEIMPTAELENKERIPVAIDRERAKAEAGKEHLKHRDESEQNKIIQYVLVKTRKDKLERWRFYFENGQVWRQSEVGRISSIRNYPINSTLSSGLFGSYRLTIGDSKRSIKVKRVK